MSRALLVYDVRGDYDRGALPIPFPPLDSSRPTVRRAIGAAAARGICLVVVQQTEPADAPPSAKGPSGWQLPDVLDTAQQVESLDSEVDPAPGGLLPSVAAALATAATS